jgi:hypothetical protein
MTLVRVNEALRRLPGVTVSSGNTQQPQLLAVSQAGLVAQPRRNRCAGQAPVGPRNIDIETAARAQAAD